MFSTTARRPRACAIASTPPRCVSFPVEEMEKAGYGDYLEPFIKAGLYKPEAKKPEQSETK